MVSLDPRTWFRHDGFPKKVEEAHIFIEEVRKQKCPSCGKSTLYPVTSEIGVKGWETKTRCGSCGSVGIFNQTGFHLELSYHKPEEAKK